MNSSPNPSSVEQPKAPEAPKKPYISPSQINLYTKCGEAWRRRYIKKEIVPPGVAMVKGTSVHKGAELNFKQKIETRQDLKLKEVVDYSVASFETTIMTDGLLLNQEETLIGRSKVVGSAKDETAKLSKLYIEESAPLYQPKHVEVTARIPLPSSSHDLLSIADVITEHDEVIEYKTGKRWSQEKADNEPQLTFQAVTFRALTGRDPKRIRVENLVNNIKPVRNPVDTTRNADDYQALINRINAVLDGINKNVFAPANPGGWWCAKNWCGYWSTCPYVKRS